MRALAAALLVLLAIPAAALDPRRRLTEYALTSWDEGLPQYLVRTFAQTPDGYLWLGTMEGLVRFDGLGFEVFDSTTWPGLRTPRIRALLVDRAGTLWIGTVGGGLSSYRDGRLTATAGLETSSVHALAEGPDGMVWVATSAGLAQVKGGALAPTAVREEVTAVHVDGGGRAWLGTSEGVARLEDGRPVPLAVEGNVSRLARGLGDTVLAALPDRVVRLRGDGTTQATVSMPFPTAYVHDVLEDARGSLWAAVSIGGLVRVGGGGTEVLEKAHGLPSNSVRAVFEDREGNVWVGTDSGISRLVDLKFVNLTTRHGLAEDNVRVVLPARGGGVWVGSAGGGVDLVQDGRVTRLGGAVPSSFVRTMVEDAAGTLWVGTDHGLERRRDGRFELISRAQGLADEKVDALALLRDGTLLVATPRALQAYRGGRFEPWLDVATPIRDVRAILEDERGTVWLGTYDGVLETRERRVVRRLGTLDGLPSATVFSLLAEGGNLWIGTHDGLVRLRDGRVAAVTPASGLPFGVVFQVLDDGRGSFWLTSNRGLTRVSRRSLEDVLEGRAARLSASTYGRRDGLGSDQCNGATQPAGAVLPDGTLAVPTAGGVSFVDPADLHPNRVPPGVVVRSVVVDGQPRERHAVLDLPWWSRRLEFHYDGLSLLAPELVRFRHRVDGFDADWVEAGPRRAAFYNSLPPGRHVFRVTAMNNDGVSSVGEAVVAFELGVPPWRRWWAFLAYALGAGGALAGLVRLRERGVRRRTDELEARVSERTAELQRAEERALDASRAKTLFLANMSHELRTPLNAVIGFAQLLARSRTLGAAERQQVSVIRRSGEHLLGLINDVLAISKIEVGKLQLATRPFALRRTLQDIAEMVRGRAEAAGLALVLDMDPSIPDLVEGDEGKLRQVLLNLLGNAVKFTPSGGRVRLAGAWRNGRASLAVEDTGVGIAEGELASVFDPFVQTASGRQAREGTGLGLAIARDLVRLMGGDIQVTSRVGEGTAFRFEVALPAATRAVEARPAGRVAGLAEGQRALRVLVVDDTVENRQLLCGLLQAVGFDVRAASNGEEALALWRSWSAEVVFMDQRMPLLDGSGATRAIRAAEAGRTAAARTVVVAVTASVFEHERDQVLAAGADDFVMKPFPEERIFEVLERHAAVRFRREPAAPAGRHVLLVEDEYVNRRVGRALLEHLGLEVSEARDGAEALEFLDHRRVDAVLLDLEMPRKDGRETLREIRGRADLAGLPVIVMTAHERSEIDLDGATDYVVKPVEEDVLAEALRPWVRLA